MKLCALEVEKVSEDGFTARGEGSVDVVVVLGTGDAPFEQPIRKAKIVNRKIGTPKKRDSSINRSHSFCFERTSIATGMLPPKFQIIA
jgi:hypothetical protein